MNSVACDFKTIKSVDFAESYTVLHEFDFFADYVKSVVKVKRMLLFKVRCWLDVIQSFPTIYRCKFSASSVVKRHQPSVSTCRLSLKKQKSLYG